MNDEKEIEVWRENWQHTDRDGLLRVMLGDEKYIKELQAKLDAVKNCKRYRIFNSVLYEPDPDGRLMLAKDVLEAIGELE